MILNKRIFRDLKDNFLRYFALFAMIVLGMMIVISMFAAAETVIKSTRESGLANHVEDGQFSVFVPLADAVTEELAEKGITVEENFYHDFSISNSSTLRIFKNRKNINLPVPDTGKLPQKDNELFLEKNYAKKHTVSIGDTLAVGGMDFTVCGIGSAPDYECAFNNLSDIGVDSKKFSIAIVSEEAYNRLKKTGNALTAEEYLYSFLLNGKMTADELKEYLTDIEFDEALITDTYLREIIDKANEKKNELNDGIANLSDGSKTLAGGLSELEGNSEALKSAAASVTNAMLLSASQQLGIQLTAESYPKILEGLYAQLKDTLPEKAAAVAKTKAQLDSLIAFENGIGEYTGGVSKALDGSEKLADGISKLQAETEKLTDEYFTVEIPNLTQFLKTADNPRIGAAADDIIINKVSAILGGVIVLILFSYVISVFVIHSIDRESQVIGALYSLGYVKKELLRHYLVLPVVIAFLGGVIGTILGILMTSSQFGESAAYFSYPNPVNSYPPYILAYGILMPPVITVLVNLLVINRKLSQSPLEMLRRERKEHKVSNISLGKMKFVTRFKIRQMLREIRASLALFGGMLISLLFMMISLNCYALVENLSAQNKADVTFNYMYSLKYSPDTVPENGEACYAKTLSKEIYGYDFDVTVMGIDSSNPYYAFEVSEKKNELTVSTSTASKYNLKEGDRITLSDRTRDQDYNFTVTHIVPYSAGLYTFMDIDAMRALFGQEEDYYNLLLSEKELAIDTGRIYSCTTYSDITGFADVMGNMMWGMILSIGAVAIVVFVVVMYLMLKMIVDRAAYSVSLVKVFGYNDSEINRLYLGGSFWVVLVSALVSVPLSKLIMDALYPLLVSNIACGLDTAFSPLMYALIFALIFVSYFVINFVLTKRLKKIPETEMLKNRE